MNDIYSTEMALARAEYELNKENNKMGTGVEFKPIAFSFEGLLPFKANPAITKVIFNNPATIVYWSDRTKTVVQCQPGDEFNKERGLALAISKKFFDNKSNFNNQFKKWCV